MPDINTIAPLYVKKTPITIKVFIILVILASIGGLAYARHDDLFATPRNPAWAMPITLPESSNFHQVSPDLYRSAQPTAQAFGEYEKLGIKTVLSLRGAGTDQELMKGTSLNLVEYPLSAGDVSDGIVIAVLRLINESPKPVLVHCRLGADRTGMVVAAYRVVFEGWTREAAIEELLKGGYGFDAKLTAVTNYISSMAVAEIRLAVLFP